jgi:hypothetical protein
MELACNPVALRKTAKSINISSLAGRGASLCRLQKSK